MPQLLYASILFLMGGVAQTESIDSEEQSKSFMNCICGYQSEEDDCECKAFVNHACGCTKGTKPKDTSGEKKDK